MNEAKMHELATTFLTAWDSQDIDRVLNCYSEDLIYRDPNTQGAVEGADAMRRFLTKLFAAWKMTWSLREAYLHDDAQGCTVLWRATFQKASGGPVIEADGMDLVMVRDNLIQRNEVWFDRTVLVGA